MYKSDMERCEPSERWRDADDVWSIVEKDIRRQVLPLTRDIFKNHVEGDILEDSDAGNLCDKRRHYLDSYVTLTKKVKGFFDAQDEYPEHNKKANEDKGNVAVAASSLPDTQIFEDTDLSKRQELWSLMVAEEVINQADRIGIARFWKTYLPDGPLHRDEVDHWIETQATDSAVDIDAIYWALELIPPTHRSRPYRIAYSYLGSGVAFQTIKKAGWVFEQLAILADRLTRLCPWSFGQAVWFLLTREPAAIPQIRSTFSSTSTEGGAPVSYVSITMKIDSETTPAEVAAHYRRILKKSGLGYITSARKRY